MIAPSGYNPSFFPDGSAAPFPMSNQFTGPELQTHFDYYQIDRERDLHPDLVPYRGCDSRTNTLVRCAVWINCCQKGMFGPIMDRSQQLMDVEGYLRS